MKVTFGRREVWWMYNDNIKAYVRLPYRQPRDVALPRGVIVSVQDGESGLHEVIFDPARRGVWVIFIGKKRGGWLARLRKAAQQVASAPESEVNPRWRAAARCERRGVWQRDGD